MPETSQNVRGRVRGEYDRGPLFPGLVFPIPVFGIEDIVISGSQQIRHTCPS